MTVRRIPGAAYDHDCTVCVFLGRYEGADLYVHPEKVDGIGTYITRTGNEGWEYESGAVFVGMNPHITEAHRRAVEDGLALTRGVGPARF